MINDLVSDEDNLYRLNLRRLKKEVSLFEQADSILVKFFGKKESKFFDVYTLTLGDLFAQTRRYFRNSFLLILRGQGPLHLSLLRGAIECTGQAYLINKNPHLVNIWRKDYGKKEIFTKTFTSSAMFPKNIPLMAGLKRDYEMACRYGAHTSLASGAATMEIAKEGIKFQHFDDDYQRTKEHMLYCLSVVARFLKAYLVFLDSFVDTSKIKGMVDDYQAKLTLACDSFRAK